ncbi:hypothetical protein U9M48_017563 [Paspalum notatum var. saurae]|uniref:BHLH domain-containing protein n=1 Tax=Paspalum notatum var. saurae TaxID=547442 RepID=A0AAQ3TAA0_PASNO
MDDDDPFYFGQDLQDAACFGEEYLMSELGLVLPPAPAPAVPAGSAFEPYQRRAPTLLMGSLTTSRRRSGGDNLQRRVFRYYLTMRRIGLGHDDAAASATGPAVAPPPPAPAAAAPRSSRFRHIMRERLRRERLSQGFADLHALLPPGASFKGGKNDIVGAAAGYIRELGARRERLRARNEVLLQRAASRWRNAAGPCMVVKVRAESDDRSTAAVVDAFETVLRRLRAMEELHVTAIRSSFCASGSMWMDVRVEGQIPAREVDKAITNALVELEGNELGKQDPGSSKPSFSCQVESGVPMD